MLVASSAFKFLQGVQTALSVLSILHLNDYLWPQDAVVNDGDNYDFIIVGAGTAGSVIANRLTEIKNVNVLRIEAGGNPPFESSLPGAAFLMKRSRYDWNYTAENEASKNICHSTPKYEFTLGKMLGGTSSLNFLVYHRGQPSDYDSWAELAGDRTWQWKNVLPYFRKIERFEHPQLLASSDKDLYGFKGFVGITRAYHESMEKLLSAYRELGHEVVLDLNERHPLGYAAQKTTISGRSSQAAAFAYLPTAKGRKNLHVMKNTLATKIIFEGKRAIGVEIRTQHGKTLHLKAKKEVIVSAGVINTPKLLMLSGVGPAEHLKDKGIEVKSNLPVGENLQEHMSVVIVHALEQLENSLVDLNTYEFVGASLTGSVALNKTSKYPDYLVTSVLSSAKTLLFYCAFSFRFTDKICDAMFKSNDTRLHAYDQIINISPLSRGNVLLRSTDPFDPPIVNLGFFSNKDDVENLIDYVQDYTAIMNTTYYKSVNGEMANAHPKCNTFGFGSRDYWRCYIMCVSNGLSHFASTCPIGKVLDGRLQVHGVENLRVADASVMPTLTKGNPGGPVMMIGEKVADFIKEDHSLLC